MSWLGRLRRRPQLPRPQLHPDAPRFLTFEPALLRWVIDRIDLPPDENGLAYAHVCCRQKGWSFLLRGTLTADGFIADDRGRDAVLTLRGGSMRDIDPAIEPALTRLRTPAAAADALRGSWATHFDIYLEHFRSRTPVPTGSPFTHSPAEVHRRDLYAAALGLPDPIQRLAAVTICDSGFTGTVADLLATTTAATTTAATSSPAA